MSSHLISKSKVIYNLSYLDVFINIDVTPATIELIAMINY